MVESLAKAIRSWRDASGLSETAALTALARTIRPDIVRSEVRGGLSGGGVSLKEDAAGGDSEYERLSGLALKGQLDAAGECRLAAILKTEESAREAERGGAGLRALGVDVDTLTAMAGGGS